jgi:hypothetical protein
MELRSLEFKTKAQFVGLGLRADCGIHWCVPREVKNYGTGLEVRSWMMFLFERLNKMIDTAEEFKVLDAIYEAMPRRNFSSQ